MKSLVASRARFASLALLVGACSSASSSQTPGTSGPPEASNPDPATPTQGAREQIELTGTFRLEPGQQRYQCFTTRLSREGGARIRSIESIAGKGVHHIAVFTDPSGREPVGERECEEMGAWGFVFGSGTSTIKHELPEGVALPLKDGIPLILQVHYLNPGEAAIESTGKAVLTLARDDEKTENASAIVVGSMNLALPPKQTSTARGRCSQHAALKNVYAAFPHMHQLGRAMRVTSGGRSLVDVGKWDFSEQVMLGVAPVATVGENAPIDTTCTYDNTTDGTVRFGLHTADEMCMAVLYYWPAEQLGTLDMCLR